jgi:uncharacterized membrane protein (DUF485 family)
MSAKHTAHEFLEDPDFKDLARRKDSISLALTVAMLVIYFGFIALLAWGKAWLGQPIGGGLTVGIPVGIGVIVASWLLTGVYVRWANAHYDAMVERMKEKIKHAD